MAIDLNALENITEFFHSDKFIISCGTATVDLRVGKILLVYNRKYKTYQFPKGRKNIGEDFLSTALRETYEESGVRPTPLPLKVETRATPAKGPVASVHLTRNILNTEPISLSMYLPDPQSGCLKMVYWFAAAADSTVPIGAGAQEEWENFDATWKPFGEAIDLLRFEEDRVLVRKVVELARNSGLALPSSADRIGAPSAISQVSA